MQFQHYGVIGMKWGVRRYQPYSVTGPRKGGKTGKEIGDAAKTRSKQNDVKSQYINSDGSLTKKGKEVFESKTTVQKKRFQKEAQEHIDQAMMKRYHEYEQSDEVKKNFKKELSVLKKARRSHSYSDEMMEATRKIDNYIFSQSDMKEFMRIGQELDELMIKKRRY